MRVQEYFGMKVKDYVIPTVGPFKGYVCTIHEIETEAGARCGWFTLIAPSGIKLILTGMEIKRWDVNDQFGKHEQ